MSLISTLISFFISSHFITAPPKHISEEVWHVFNGAEYEEESVSVGASGWEVGEERRNEGRVNNSLKWDESHFRRVSTMLHSLGSLYSSAMVNRV